MLFSPAFAALTHFARPVGRAGTRMHNTMPLMTASTFPAWSKSIEAVAQFHGVDRQAGLTTQQVADKRRQYGFNELEKAPGKPMWRLVLEQFDDMMVKVLLLAAFVSFLLAFFDEASAEEGIRAYIEPAVIILILVLNAVVGVWQESNAEAALEALKEMQSETAVVTRDGAMISDLPSRELVPGDLVEMHVGDKVPADIRIIALKTATLRSEQASLTGESVAVLKGTEAVQEDGCELQAKECMLFAGTAISNGSCLGIVNDIGMSTEIGKIQAQITAAESEEEDSPLKKKLDEFGELLAKCIFVICLVVWLINYSNFLSWETDPNTYLPRWETVNFSLVSCIYYFKIAVALAVAAIPEGLPAVITTCLALGTRKMAKRHAIVRKLPSVETLGCTTVICSDKTGTLTTNQMSVCQLHTIGVSAADVRTFGVLGTSFNPDQGSVVDLGRISPNLEAIAEVCALCNEAQLECKAGVYRAVGAPTEAALVCMVEKLGLPDQAEHSSCLNLRRSDPETHAMPVTKAYGAKARKLATLEFDRERKTMSVICTAPPAASNGSLGRMWARSGKGHNQLLVKGAAECVLQRCTQVMLESGDVREMTEDARRALTQSIDDQAAQGRRILAFAHKTSLGPLANYDGPSHAEHARLVEPENYAGIESGMVFLGMAALEDPPRPEVRDAIEECTLAGIRVIVITGDNKLTAEAICRQIGVFTHDEDVTGKSMTGRNFTMLSPDKQRAVLMGDGGRCFSRAEPKHKQDIVRLLKQMGHIAAMTGDGVNDAPALKLADIGIAMGITGTEVAKEAADMVLADDNFSTIVAAVEEGRAIYNNMKAFIRYMISSNIGEVASIFLTAATGLPEGLIPVQLLWVNLVTDGPPATALGFNPPDVDIMERPPRSPKEQLITPWIFFRWMLVGTYVGFATVGAFVAWYMHDSFLGLDLSQDGHSTVTWYQLTHWNQCSTWRNFHPSSYTAGDRTIGPFKQPCDYFHEGKAKASTLSLSVLVAIEMFNALNALSEDNSLLQMPPWCNPWLLVAGGLSMGLHFLILYVPFLADIFSIVPLNLAEWGLVFIFSFPVIIIDEVLKFVGRTYVHPRPKTALAEAVRKRKSKDL